MRRLISTVPYMSCWSTSWRMNLAVALVLLSALVARMALVMQTPHFVFPDELWNLDLARHLLSEGAYRLSDEGVTIFALCKAPGFALYAGRGGIPDCR